MRVPPIVIAQIGDHRYLHKHEPAIEVKIVGVETVDHPTDGQIAAYAKKYFRRIHGMA